MSENVQKLIISEDTPDWAIELALQSIKENRKVLYLERLHDEVEFVWEKYYYSLEPKKQKTSLIKVEELPVICYVSMTMGSTSYLLVSFNTNSQEVKLSRVTGWCSLEELHSHNYKWSKDRKNWNSFEVESEE
jgi:hypothetical protein